jgi:NAD(P)-dependent dehydrogenase (short-subunit alcohol dehydrogenase family)
MATLAGKTLFITGASRGIGKAIALRAARDGANVAIVAKTAEPHPKLPGTFWQEAFKANRQIVPFNAMVKPRQVATRRAA